MVKGMLIILSIQADSFESLFDRVVGICFFFFFVPYIIQCYHKQWWFNVSWESENCL